MLKTERIVYVTPRNRNWKMHANWNVTHKEFPACNKKIGLMFEGINMFWPDSGSVYTNAVSFVTASFSMRLRLLFTRHRSRPLPKPGRFENAAKSGAFSKRYGFICRVNSETALIWIRLLFWREICIVRLKMVNLARSASLAHTITTLIFWRKRIRVNTSKPYRFWRGLEVMKPRRCETAFV